jgi:plastocyanin
MAVKDRGFEKSINAARGGGLGFLRQQLMLVALIGLIALALSACGTGDAATPATGDDNDARPTVVIDDLAFSPETLTIEAGDTVTWTWRDGAIDHDVSGDDFQSEVISEGTFRHRFNEPGTYEYICTLHPNMTGTIEVTE